MPSCQQAMIDKECENGVATMDQGKYLEVVHDEMCLFTLLTTFIKPLVGSKWTNEKLLTVMEKYSYVKYTQISSANHMRCK